MEHCGKTHLGAHNNNVLFGFSSIPLSLHPPTPLLRNFAPEKRIHFCQFRSKFNIVCFVLFCFFWGGGGCSSLGSLVFMTCITRKAATLVTSIADLQQWRIMFGAVTKESKRKLDPTETPSRLITRLLVVFTLQLEILVTTLNC